MKERSETAYWESIYGSKASEELGWYQEMPATSLEWIEALGLPLDARIMDAGGGDSRLVDCLLDKGYRNITVLDISENALQRARERLGERAGLVKWICADLKNYEGETIYELWHDRACFHFLLKEQERQHYRDLVLNSLSGSGYMILGSFSKNGPRKCSGLDIRQHSDKELKAFFEDLEHIRSADLEHYTPTGNLQNYIFCTFRKN